MATKADKDPSLFKTIGILWRTLAKDIADPYRPELYYMRGPGPRWREKHGLVGDVSVDGLPAFMRVTA